MRGTTAILVTPAEKLVISIHVPREGDDDLFRQRPAESRISIHVPREGDDVGVGFAPLLYRNFNPRPP